MPQVDQTSAIGRVMHRMRGWLGTAKHTPLDDDQRLTPVRVQLTGHQIDMFDYRTEDIRISPNGRRVALAETSGKIMLYELHTGTDPLQFELLTILASDDITMPHGVAWLDDDHIVVANRKAGLAFFEVPRRNRWDKETPVSALTQVQPSWFGKPGEQRKLLTRKIVTGAGSVRAKDGYLYVSSNKDNTVTKHRVLPGPTCDDGEVIAQKGINIPDSAVPSPDAFWLAVSDHENKRILMFRTGQDEPVATLTDEKLAYPHGAVFDPTGKYLIVADAGSPFLHVFHAPNGNWGVDRSSVEARIEVVEKDVFERVQEETPEHVRHLEGGSKGVDIMAENGMILVTCRGQMIKAFELNA